LIEGLDRNVIGAVWDAAHEALAGQETESSLDTVADLLIMVNLKNAFYVKTNGPESREAKWSRHFTSGRQGLASWERVVKELRRRHYSGVVCLTAEYTAESEVDRLIAEDLQYARDLLAASLGNEEKDPAPASASRG
jgi:sugar phosphate isomerase/epimerase